MAATPRQRSLIGRIGAGTSSNKEGLITEKLEILVNENVRQIYRLPLDPVVKKLGPFPGTLSFADQHRELGRLDNLTVRVVSGSYNGARELYLHLYYEATSLGGKTGGYTSGFGGLGQVGGIGGVVSGSTAWQVVYFKDSGGGVLFAWHLLNNFYLDCGWRNMGQTFTQTITGAANVDWFDDWEMVEHHVEGTFYDC